MNKFNLTFYLVCALFTSSSVLLSEQGRHNEKHVRATSQIIELESEKLAELSKNYKGTPEQKKEILDAFTAYLKEKFPQSDKKILLKFGAVWCAPCKIIHPEIEKFASRKAAEYEVINIDLDAYKGLGRALELKGVPTVYDLLNGAQTNLGNSEDRVGPISAVPDILEYLNSK